MTLKALAAGMVMLAGAFNRDVSEDVIRLYHAILKDKLTDQQFEAGLRKLLLAESYFPSPATILRYCEPTQPTTARAAELYDRILDHYERGEQLGPREISERYGAAARDAFVAAGGTRAFAWCEPTSAPFRRKAFLEGWAEATEYNPEAALPAAPDQRLLGQ